MGLLAELQRIVVNPLGFVPAFLLQAQGFLTNGLQILQRMLAIGFMLFSVLSFELNSVGFDLLDLLMSLLAAGFESLGVLTLQLNRFLIQLLATLQGFLLKLLAAGGELLLQLRQLALHLLLQRRPLLSRFLEQLLTLLTRLFTHLIHLPFSFLADRGVAHQLFALTLGLLNNLFGVPAGGVDELVPAIQKLAARSSSFGNSSRTASSSSTASVSLTRRPPVKGSRCPPAQLPPADRVDRERSKGSSSSQLAGKAELKILLRSFSTYGGTMWSIDPPKRATSFTTELLRKLWRAVVAMNTVSRSSASDRLVWAICSSYSKSLIARRPLRIRSARWVTAQFTVRPSKLITSTPESVAVRICSIRSSTLNAGRLLGLLSTATTTSKQAHRPLDQVHMTIGERVETAGVERPHRESAMGGSYAGIAV